MSKYQIVPWSIPTFVAESTVKPPRFQRKYTWKSNQNFELCISVFMEYPIGVVVINHDDNSQEDYLLDGRQRRHALQLMRNEPTELYKWAKKYIGFDTHASEQDIKDKFWVVMDRFLQKETEENIDNESSSINDNTHESVDEDLIIDWSQEGTSLSEESKTMQVIHKSSHLDLLLQLILLLHTKWMDPFDFHNYHSRLPYFNETEKKIDPSKLHNFIIRDILPIYTRITPSDFVEILGTRDILPGKEEHLKKVITERWAEINKVISLFCLVEKNVFLQSHIGVIILDNATHIDSQNIFTNINKNGSPLKAEELLSAKPFWNTALATYNPNIVPLVDAIYKKMEIYRDGQIVRWDVAASLIDRINSNFFFAPKMANEKPEQMLARVTLGFKLLSAKFSHGIAKGAVEDLELNPYFKDIDTTATSFVDTLNEMIDVLLSDSFFRQLQNEKLALRDLLGNAITFELIVNTYENWEEKAKPTPGETNYDAFILDTKRLFDRLVLEYTNGSWSGSGDSKFAHNVQPQSSSIRRLIANADDWNSCTNSIKAFIQKEEPKEKVFRLYFKLLTQGMNIVSNNAKDTFLELRKAFVRANI